VNPGAADAINRRDVTFMVAKLDALHHRALKITPAAKPWWNDNMADVIMREDDAIRPDQAWIIGHLAAGIPGIAFDGCPADCDWDNFFQHFRAAILARRDPKTPHAKVAENAPCGVV